MSILIVSLRTVVVINVFYVHILVNIYLYSYSYLIIIYFAYPWLMHTIILCNN